MSWQHFEQRIRDIASIRWNCNAVSETIAGIKCDCILKLDSDNWIAIEITEECNLEKVRSDIVKLRTVKNSLMLDDIYCKCYIVLKKSPTDSMRATGSAEKITVMSVEEFQNEYFDYKSYVHLRKNKHFGSLINVETGEPENNIYVDVFYVNNKTGEELNIAQIVQLLKAGKKIILKGDFGLGKSRCVRQVFDILTKNTEEPNDTYAISINLREHWGSKWGKEILNRHFIDLGLDAKNFMKAYDQSNVIYLLDGFDEIGTQSWSSDVKRMQHIREISVCALKDLITYVRGGMLITGREYYFNSDKEMLRCLGLNENDTIILECHNEFTESEILTYISKNTSEKYDNNMIEKLPAWFPKRPLVIQVLLRYASEVFSLDYALDDICGFWYAFFTKMCEREAKIYPALNPDAIKNVFVWLANKTRTSVSNTGPITQSDLSAAFVAATGLEPNDESSIMLQRLPTLGRISADSPDRQFLDSFMLNALRAEGIIQLLKSGDTGLFYETWKNPLDYSGSLILSEYIFKHSTNLNNYLAVAERASNLSNKILASDIVSAICLLKQTDLDFKDLYIGDSHFTHLSFEGKEIHKLTICNSIIEKLDITNTKFNDTLTIKECLINSICGIASHKSLPKQISECEVENFEHLATTALIKKAKLTDSQKLLIEIIRKIFFQPGAGRKEEALLRGMGKSANKQMGKKILNKLLDEDLITRHKGDEGYIYKPVRSKTVRMEKILTDLTLSTDSIWLDISKTS